MTLDARYGRITIEQLLRATDDRKVAEALANDALPRREPMCSPAQARALDIGQTWDAIDYLLECADGPLEIVAGSPFVPKLAGVSYLTDDQVGHAADWLTAVSFDELMGSIDPDNPGRRIYKMNLALPSHRAEIRDNYDALALFFAAAARHDEAVLIIYE